MKDHQQEDEKIAWETLLIVSGFSFLLFSLFLYAIQSAYVLFLKISLVFLVAGSIAWVYQMAKSPSGGEKSKKGRRVR